MTEKDNFEKAAADFVEAISKWDTKEVLVADTAKLRKQAQDIMKRRAKPPGSKNPERA